MNALKLSTKTLGLYRSRLRCALVFKFFSLLLCCVFAVGVVMAQGLIKPYKKNRIYFSLIPLSYSIEFQNFRTFGIDDRAEIDQYKVSTMGLEASYEYIVAEQFGLRAGVGYFGDSSNRVKLETVDYEMTHSSLFFRFTGTFYFKRVRGKGLLQYMGMGLRVANGNFSANGSNGTKHTAALGYVVNTIYYGLEYRINFRKTQFQSSGTRNGMGIFANLGVHNGHQLAVDESDTHAFTIRFDNDPFLEIGAYYAFH